MTISDAEADWTTSRISRLLRPLKCKCLALLSYLKETPTVTTTYGSRYLPSSQELSSSKVPSNIGIRIHFSKDTVQSLELSRRIYAVRDCYSDLISKADAFRQDATTGSPTLTSLADLCSVILGAQIPCNEADGLEYEAEANSSEVLFGAIPPAYRFRTLLMHALHIILDSCPPCGSLYLTLLDLTLERRLYHESEVLLDLTLEHAFESPRDDLPRISNPIHRRFLVDLYYKWHTQFSSSTYVRLVTRALRRAPLDIVWTSKAVRLFARKIGRYDITLLPVLLGGLMDVVLARRMKLKGKQVEIDHIQKQVREWFNIYTETCLSSMERVSTRRLVFESITLVEDILDHCRARAFQSSNDLLGSGFLDAIACLYTFWLVHEPRTISKHDVLYTLLQQSFPSSSTFTLVCLQILPFRSLDDCEDILCIFSSTLLHHGLPRLQASLWTCALYCVEQPEMERIIIDKNGREHVRKVRLRLVAHVEEAQSRCFAASPHGNRISLDAEIPYGDEEITGESLMKRERGPTVACWFRRDESSEDHLPGPPKRRKTIKCPRPSFEEHLQSRPPYYICSSGGARYSKGNPFNREAVQQRQEYRCASPVPPSVDENVSTTSLLHGTLPVKPSLNREQLEMTEDRERGEVIAVVGTVDFDDSDDTCTDEDEGDGDNLCVVGLDQAHPPSEDFLDLFRITDTSSLVR